MYPVFDTSIKQIFITNGLEVVCSPPQDTSPAIINNKNVADAVSKGFQILLHMVSYQLQYQQRSLISRSFE